MNDENTFDFQADAEDARSFKGEGLVPRNHARAQRRRTRKHLQRARKNFWGRDLDGRNLGMVVDTPKPHTCGGCGNPRKYHGELSMQERRAIQRERVIETEVGEPANDDNRAQRSAA